MIINGFGQSRGKSGIVQHSGSHLIMINTKATILQHC